jgi:alkylation response protein AidB-like acyl-CoA dehydrogenase
MGHYRSNLRDLEFALFEVFGRGRVLGQEPFAEMDEVTARSVLDEVDRLAKGVYGESFTECDRRPPTFDPASGSVIVPDGVKHSVQAYYRGEWHRLDLPAELGGFGAPPSLRWAAAELLLGANPAVFMYTSGHKFARFLHALGTPDQRRLAEMVVERHWGGTMVLTEPDAGSDVGAGRTRATRQPEGSWHIEGVKRFITSADWDWPENIVHFVLARPEGHGPGTKGLSLFVVPKFHVKPDGSLGERNGVYVTNLEHKMGLKASATCELRFGERHPAVGWLLGESHDGIAQMFRVIEDARMMVGTKAIATLSTGYLTALESARTRVQGADLTRAADWDAPRVTIVHHPDVRRMLMLQKSYAEGMRALVLYAATLQDSVEIARAQGRTDPEAERRNDLLLPVVKGVGSERSYELLGTCMQVLGGSGYLEDYPIEQYTRDAKIDTLYEGTTSIQGLDLFFRKIVRDRGQTLAALASDILDFAKGDAGNGALAGERRLLGQGLEDVQGIVGAMVAALGDTQKDVRSVYRAGLNTTRLLLALGDLLIAWLLLREGEVAASRLADDRLKPSERVFYAGKVAAARFFARTRLPLLAAERAVAEASDLDLMDLDEAGF